MDVDAGGNLGVVFFLLREVKFDFSLRILGGISDFSRRIPGLSVDVGFTSGVVLVLCVLV